MTNLSTFVKRLRDIMRNDAGINGDAQRIEQNWTRTTMSPSSPSPAAGATGPWTTAAARP